MYMYSVCVACQGVIVVFFFESKGLFILDLCCSCMFIVGCIDCVMFMWWSV